MLNQFIFAQRIITPLINLVQLNCLVWLSLHLPSSHHPHLCASSSALVVAPWPLALPTQGQVPLGQVDLETPGRGPPIYFFAVGPVTSVGVDFVLCQVPTTPNSITRRTTLHTEHPDPFHSHLLSIHRPQSTFGHRRHLGDTSSIVFDEEGPTLRSLQPTNDTPARPCSTSTIPDPQNHSNQYRPSRVRCHPPSHVIPQSTDHLLSSPSSRRCCLQHDATASWRGTASR